MMQKPHPLKYRKCTAVLYLALAGSNPDDPTNLAIPILPGQKKTNSQKSLNSLTLPKAFKIFLPQHTNTLLYD